MTTKRIGYLDGVKFIAMLLCIQGHLIQNGSYHASAEEWTADPMFLFIYSFHMQLFLFISGMFFGNNAKLTPPQFVKRKFFQLMIPSYMWNFLIVGLFAVINIFFERKIEYSTSMLSPYWFMTMLFFSYLITYVLFYISKTRAQLSLNTLITIIIVSLLPGEAYSHVNSFYVFFLLGYFLKDYILSESHKKLDTLVIILSSIVYIALWQFWHFKYTVYQSPLDYNCIIRPELIKIALLRIFLAVCAILVIVLSIKKLKCIFSCRIFLELGPLTLGVYLLQSPIILLIGTFAPINTRDMILRDFLIIPLMAIAIYFLLAYFQVFVCKNRCMAFLFYGKSMLIYCMMIYITAG